jgi:hypothetical protein
MPRLTTLNFNNPLGQSFWIMRVFFTVAPILFGLDTFFNIMVNWTDYLAPWIPNLIHVSPQTFMHGVGVIEICAGILVGFWPEYFAYVLTLWLFGIIINLLTTGGNYDIVLRDVGLLIGALSLARLAQIHHLERQGRLELAPTATEPTPEPVGGRRAA